MIFTTKVAKEAWNILHVSFEGIDVVGESRLELLTTKFKNLWMSEEETINDFNGRLCDIANKSFTFGEKILEKRLVKKGSKIFAFKVHIQCNNIKGGKGPKKYGT